MQSKSLLRSFVGDSRVITIGVGVNVAIGFGVSLRLGAAARALGELALDFLDRLGFRHVLDDGDLAR
jgi:hypothetical protein